MCSLTSTGCPWAEARRVLRGYTTGSADRSVSHPIWRSGSTRLALEILSHRRLDAVRHLHQLLGHGGVDVGVDGDSVALLVGGHHRHAVRCHTGGHGREGCDLEAHEVEGTLLLGVLQKLLE